MSHDSNKIYKSGELGISTSDVAVVLGSTSHDVGQLCTSGNINMWATYKPVRWSELCPNRASDNWCKSENNNYGILPKVFNTADLQSVANYYTSDNKHGWQYQKCEGPYRLADFNGYRHNAKPPYGGMNVQNIGNWGGKIKVNITPAIHATDGSEVTFEMLLGKSYIHPAIAIKDTTESTYVVQLSQNLDSYPVTDKHTYKIWPMFYCTNSVDATAQFTTETLYTCVGVAPLTHTAESNLELWGSAYQQGDFLFVNIYVVNKSNAAITIDRCYVMSRTSDDYLPSTISGNEEIWVDNASFTIPAGGSTEIYHPTLGIRPDLPISDIHLMVTLDNAAKQVRIPIRTYSSNLTPEEL